MKTEGLNRMINDRDLAVVARDHLTDWGSLSYTILTIELRNSRYNSHVIPKRLWQAEMRVCAVLEGDERSRGHISSSHLSSSGGREMAVS